LAGLGLLHQQPTPWPRFTDTPPGAARLLPWGPTNRLVPVHQNPPALQGALQTCTWLREVHRSCMGLTTQDHDNCSMVSVVRGPVRGLAPFPREDTLVATATTAAALEHPQKVRHLTAQPPMRNSGSTCSCAYNQHLLLHGRKPRHTPGLAPHSRSPGQSYAGCSGRITAGTHPKGLAVGRTHPWGGRWADHTSVDKHGSKWLAGALWVDLGRHPQEHG
jgi:hypothetical protein